MLVKTKTFDGLTENEWRAAKRSGYDKILEQARKIVAAYPEGALLKKNIVLLTDKWDDVAFIKIV